VSVAIDAVLVFDADVATCELTEPALSTLGLFGVCADDASLNGSTVLDTAPLLDAVTVVDEVWLCLLNIVAGDAVVPVSDFELAAVELSGVCVSALDTV